MRPKCNNQTYSWIVWVKRHAELLCFMLYFLFVTALVLTLLVIYLNNKQNSVIDEFQHRVKNYTTIPQTNTHCTPDKHTQLPSTATLYC
jgi:hypothetical protein